MNSESVSLLSWYWQIILDGVEGRGASTTQTKQHLAVKKEADTVSF